MLQALPIIWVCLSPSQILEEGLKRGYVYNGPFLEQASDLAFRRHQYWTVNGKRLVVEFRRSINGAWCYHTDEWRRG